MKSMSISKFPKRGTLRNRDEQETIIFVALNGVEIMSWSRTEGSLNTSWPWIIANIMYNTSPLAIKFHKNK